MRGPSLRLTLPLACCLLCVSASPVVAGTAEAPTRTDAVLVDRVAVRFVSPETGGSSHPRFFTERELAFWARVEALLEQTALDANDYPERYVRSAVDRLVARKMLSSLLVQRGVEPPNLGVAVAEARGDLEARLAASREGTLADAMKSEGISEDELAAFLRDEVRATYYIDRTLTPILSVSEDTLRESFRTAMHPYRGQKFDDVRAKLRRWLVTERLRAAEIEFLQGARARIKITTVEARSVLGPASAQPPLREGASLPDTPLSPRLATRHAPREPAPESSARDPERTP